MKSNIQRISRAAVCLVLVCCLIVNISPVKARAVDPATAVAFDFAARSVIASVLQGLGVSKGSDPTVFDSIVNSAVDALSTATNFISDGLAKVARFNLPSGLTAFFFPLSIIETLLKGLWDEGILESENGSLAVSYYSYDGSLNEIVFSGPGFAGTAIVGDYIYDIKWSSEQVTYTINGGRTWTLASNDYGYFSDAGWVEKRYYTSFNSPTIGDYSSITTSSAKAGYSYLLENVLMSTSQGITTPYDLSLGEIGTSDQTFDDAYSTWAENTVSVPGSVYGSDDDYVPSVPIAVAPDYEGTTNISQSDVQAGNSTWVDTETDTDIGTDTAPEALAGTVAGTIAWDFISGLFDVFVPGFELISNTIEGIGALIKALPQTLKDVFGIDAFLEKISAIYETVVQGFIETAAGIKSLPQAIADALAAIFVPSSDYITAKVEAIRAKFPFMDSIIATGEYIRDSLSGSSGPPAIYVDLTLADGDIDYGEKTLLTDFSWYAPYKGTVDSVLGAALWAFFGWRVFLRLPGLISGADGYVGEIRTLSSRSSGSGGRKKED